MSLWRRAMKYPHVQKKLNHESAPASKGRRSFIGGMATLGAGLAGSVILPTTAIAQATPEAPPKTKLTASSYGRGTVIASDTATVAETTAGKIRGFKRNGVYDSCLLRSFSAALAKLSLEEPTTSMTFSKNGPPFASADNSRRVLRWFRAGSK